MVMNCRYIVRRSSRSRFDGKIIVPGIDVRVGDRHISGISNDFGPWLPNINPISVESSFGIVDDDSPHCESITTRIGESKVGRIP